MKRKIIVLATIVGILALMSALTLAQRDMTPKRPQEDHVTTDFLVRLRKLDLLYRNAFRVVDEYDTSDESKDTLLWSKERSEREIRAILQEMLSERKALHEKTELKNIIYRSQVEKMRLSVPESPNAYFALLRIANTIQEMYPSLRILLQEEVSQALSCGYSPEAYEVVTMEVDHAQGVEEQNALLMSYLSRFEKYPERFRIRMDILKNDYLSLSEEKGKTMTSPEQANEWIRRSDGLDTRLEALRTPYREYGFDYEREVRVINPERLYAPTFMAKVTDLGAGTVTLSLRGIAEGTWEVKEGGNNTIFALDIPRKALINEEKEVTLKKRGRHELSLYRKGNSERSYMTLYLDMDKVDARIQRTPKGYEVLAFARTDGHPISGAEVQVFQTRTNSPKILGTGKTAQDGTALITPQPRSEETVRVVVRHPDMQEKEFYAYAPSKPHGEKRDKWEDELLFYPDRSIYRRGQEVRVGLVLRSTKGVRESRLIPQHKGTVTLRAIRNGDEVEVDQAKYATDDNGVAEIAFDLPLDPSMSDYHLVSDEDDYCPLQVEDYKLSYLTVRLDSVPTGFTKGRVMRVYGRTEDLNHHGIPAEITLTYSDKEDKVYTLRSGDDGTFAFTTDRVSGEWGTSLRLKATDALGHVSEDGRFLSSYDVSLPLSPAPMVRAYEKSRIRLSTEGQPYRRLPLGDFSRYRITASLIARGGEVIKLGEIPADGERTFVRRDLKSGMYSLRLEAQDYFGKEVREEVGGLYLYSNEDDRFYGDTTLFAQKIDKGTILLASSEKLFALIEYQEREGSTSVELKSLEAGKMYRLTDSTDRPIRKISATWEGASYVSDFYNRDEDEERTPDSRAMIELKGISDSTTFRPGDRFEHDLMVTLPSGKPAKQGTPVIVTVYDTALDDAGGELSWPHVIPDRTLMLLETRALSGMNYGEGIAMPMAALKVSEDRVGATDQVARQGFGGGNNVRRNFVENAFFSALLRTDEAGRVRLGFRLPDTETTFRIKMYTFTPDLKVDGEEKRDIKVEQPLSIDLSLPRYLRHGDTLSGQLRLRSLRPTQDDEASWGLLIGGKAKKSGTAPLRREATVTVPFDYRVTSGDSLTLRAWVASGEERDAIERVLPLRPAVEQYHVAVPITVFDGTSLTLTLPKVDSRTETPALLELFTSPLHLLLSETAKSYDPEEKVGELSLFGLTVRYSTLAEITEALDQSPALRKSLIESARALEKLPGEAAQKLSRQASPQELARFYTFISDRERVLSRMKLYDKELLRYTSKQEGGFFYSPEYPTPSAWLTHALLYNLRGAQGFFSPGMKTATKEGLTFLRRSLSDKARYYRPYIDLELLLRDYGEKPLTDLSPDARKEYRRQVESLRTNYRTSSTSTLVRYADYARTFDKAGYEEVRRFISDRIPYTESDLERLVLELFLSEEGKELRPEVVRFMLSLKQGTMWDDPFYLRAATLLLSNLPKDTVSGDAQLRIGDEVHTLTPYEVATGHIIYPIHRSPSSGTLLLSWTGISTPVIIGGVRYEVEQPIHEITPTGDKLTVSKEIYTRRAVGGKPTLTRLVDNKAAHPGEEVIVRYLIEAKQDLSLVTLSDLRAAGLEQGYDFRGYGISDRLWWSYSRREDRDEIYIDYLPKGKHVLELRAVANVGGSFSYGPARIQSYYAPEYAGNSSGGSFRTEPYSK